MTTIHITDDYHNIVQAVRAFMDANEPVCKVGYSSKHYTNAASCAATIATSIRRNKTLTSVCCRRRGACVYLVSTNVDANSFKTIIERL